LNAALLKRDYGLKHWDIPKDNLCPGIPGRLDYIHLLKDLLGDKGITAKHEGTGASN
jgi:23S rRNA (adenine1618-N6)-methyltransferase